MRYSKIRPFLWWAAALQFFAILAAIEHKAWDVVFICLMVIGGGVWFARNAQRLETPKQHS
ncbi:hypothetical protein [Pseudomonas entomophila]|uniref:hypothetical protein n=1 Tax=Pseudomonas entomophila TaxID=312306 RepID=UPI00200FC48D|nr:hypothetical protein [Pseudomonas entomophila]